MSLKIQIKLQKESKATSAELLSSSPEKKDRAYALRASVENVLAREPRDAQASRPLKPLRSKLTKLTTTPSEQQLLTTARRLIKKAQKIFNQQGPTEESIKFCNQALGIPLWTMISGRKGSLYAPSFMRKELRSGAAEPWDLDCALQTQEILLNMDYNCAPIEKAKLMYMIARNVFAKALQEQDLSGIKRTIFIMHGILGQDCLNDYQRVGSKEI